MPGYVAGTAIHRPIAKNLYPAAPKFSLQKVVEGPLVIPTQPYGKDMLARALVKLVLFEEVAITGGFDQTLVGVDDERRIERATTIANRPGQARCAFRGGLGLAAPRARLDPLTRLLLALARKSQSLER